LFIFLEENLIKKLNETLIIDDMDGFTHVLKNPILNLNHLLNEFAIPLYFEELKVDRCDINVRHYFILRYITLIEYYLFSYYFVFIIF